MKAVKNERPVSQKRDLKGMVRTSERSWHQHSGGQTKKMDQTRLVPEVPLGSKCQFWRKVQCMVMVTSENTGHWEAENYGTKTGQ